MDFLIKAFIRKLKSYSFLKFEISKNEDGTYRLVMFDVPPEIDVKILRNKVNVKTDAYLMKKDIHGLEYKDFVYSKEPIATPIEKTLRRHLVFNLSLNDYAAKINKVDEILRDYSESVRYHTTTI